MAAKKKEKKPVHVVEFPLQATPADIRSVQVRFDFLRQLYNAALAELFKRNDRLCKDNVYEEKLNLYRQVLKQLKAKSLSEKESSILERKRKALSRVLNEKMKEYHVTEASIHSFTTTNKNACCFSHHLDAHTTQTIATRAYRAFSDWKFGVRGKPRFKSWKRAIHSAEGKAKSCLTIAVGDDTKPTRLKWRGLEFPFILSKKDNHGYEAAALALIGDGKWKYCRILSRYSHGRDRLYVQVILDGESFKKNKHKLQAEKSKGIRVGVDMAPSGFAAVSNLGAMLSPLGLDIKVQLTEIKRLQRQNARRLRLANPDNYSSHQKRKGKRLITVYKVKKGARVWVKSKAYLATEVKIKEIYRVLAAKRKQGHDILANDVIALGNIVLAEKLSYKAWQKMFGRSVGAYAPGHFIQTLRRKAENAGGKVIDINARSAKLSQYDHVLNEYHKKKLSERIHLLGGVEPVQRDLYSAFLAMCVCENEHLVPQTIAHEAWSGVRHSLDAAVVQAIETASSRAMPTSFGLRELGKLKSELLVA